MNPGLVFFCNMTSTVLMPYASLYSVLNNELMRIVHTRHSTMIKTEIALPYPYRNVSKMVAYISVLGTSVV
ncbi:hypothetical protein D3C79_1075640 [compost metagenome]